jgi:ribonuclease P protein component
VVATKKISKRAVVRNRIKRIIREFIRINTTNGVFVRNIDYEVIAKKTFLLADFDTLGSEFKYILKKIKKTIDS